MFTDQAEKQHQKEATAYCQINYGPESDVATSTGNSTTAKANRKKLVCLNVPFKCSK